MTFFSQQWQLFCLAVMFFTRFPVPKSTPYSADLMNKANRYFPLVGLLIAILLSGLYFGLRFIFPLDIAVLLIMIASLLFTGAFHEDGLADMSDGMGGGFSVEKRLAIMKDSRIGTYGAVTLLVSLLLKFTLLVALAKQELLISSLVLAYVLSRAVAASLIFNTAYVSDEASSKSKPLANQQSLIELLMVLSCGFLALVVFIKQPWFITLVVSVVISLAVFRFIFRRWLIKRISGFTGDCLGAAQQISELVIYLCIVAVNQYAMNGSFSSVVVGAL